MLLCGITSLITTSIGYLESQEAEDEIYVIVLSTPQHELYFKCAVAMPLRLLPPSRNQVCRSVSHGILGF